MRRWKHTRTAQLPGSTQRPGCWVFSAPRSFWRSVLTLRSTRSTMPSPNGKSGIGVNVRPKGRSRRCRLRLLLTAAMPMQGPETLDDHCRAGGRALLQIQFQNPDDGRSARKGHATPSRRSAQRPKAIVTLPASAKAAIAAPERGLAARFTISAKLEAKTSTLRRTAFLMARKGQAPSVANRCQQQSQLHTSSQSCACNFA